MVSAQKIIARVTETHWSKLYIATATCQCIIIIILQALICYQNTLQVSVLPAANTTNKQLSDIELIASNAADRLSRIKWENISFIGFQLWFLGMALDATVYQNTAEILALAIINVLCAVLGALEVVDGFKWMSLLSRTPYTTLALSVAEKIEIALSVVILLFACAMCYLSYEMSRQFGWNIYKKIGADIQIQRMYRMFQFFVLALKIDIFTQFMVSIFYLIQFAANRGFEWRTVIQIVVTVVMLPMFYFARTAGSAESKARMLVFIVFEVIVLGHYILVLTQTIVPGNNWYTWICLVCLGVAVDFATIVLGVFCMMNFNKGLKPHVQRGQKNKMIYEVELNKGFAKSTWQIDDD
ncbi:hypothetical protein BDF14DRAFT_1835325 [Spinellus fusiger]|nr:hypothetical protein BDF14DRAFT_1835325 [Spinellus fusiger]